MRPTGTALAPANVIELERDPRQSCRPGWFPERRLTPRPIRHLRARLKHVIDQSGDRASREDRKPWHEPNGHRSDRHYPRRQIVHSSMSPSYRPDKASHALLNELLAGTHPMPRVPPAGRVSALSTSLLRDALMR